MTEEIKEETKCKYFYYGDCKIYGDGCLENDDCEIRQLKRLEQENNSLQAQLNNITVQSNK